MGLTQVSGPVTGTHKNVFVSASRQSDKSVMKVVLQYLAHFSVRVFTYDGSDYKLTDLTRMDYLIIVPPAKKGVELDNGRLSIPVGMGQYNEISWYIDNRDRDNIFTVTSVEEGLHISEFCYLTAAHGNNWAYIADLHVSNESIEIVNFTNFIPKDSYYELIDSLNDPVNAFSNFDYKSQYDAYAMHNITATPLPLYLALSRPFI